MDAVLCPDGPVKTLVGSALAPEHRRGHGTLYDGLNNHGRLNIARVRMALAALPLPRAADGRLVLTVDISPWLRPDTSTALCHAYGRGKNEHRMIPGRPYSIVAALEPGRTSWTARLDAIRLEPGADALAVTAVQLRQVVERLFKQTLGWTTPKSFSNLATGSEVKSTALADGERLYGRC